MRAILATITVCVLSDVALLAAEPPQQVRSRPLSFANANQSQARRDQIRDTQVLMVRSLNFGEGLWPDEASHGENQLVTPKTTFGPPSSESRKTLFQWSYGTSFEGGPNLDEPLVTDRPDFTEASSTVGRGVLQIESGYTYVRNKDPGDDSTTHSAGEVLFRYGIFADWLEFRLQVLPVSQTSSTGVGPSTTTSGVGDLYLGAKISLAPQEGIWPELAVMPQMTVPSGSRAFTNNEVLPGVNWLYGWDINDFVALGMNTQFNQRVDGGTGDKYLEVIQTASFAYSLTDKLGAYTEWFMLSPTGADTEQVEHYIDGGFTYLLSNDVQFDIRAGYGLSSAADDFFAGTGLSIRFK